jgi:hypothetical protein
MKKRNKGSNSIEKQHRRTTSQSAGDNATYRGDEKYEKFVYSCQTQRDAAHSNGYKNGCLHRRSGETPERLQHDHDDDRLYAAQHKLELRESAVMDVEPGYPRHDQRCWKDETGTGHDQSGKSGSAISDVNRHFRGVRARYEIGCSEQIQEFLMAEPVSPLDDFGFHQGDVRRRTAETDGSQLEEKKSDFAEGRHDGPFRLREGRCCP